MRTLLSALIEDRVEMESTIDNCNKREFGYLSRQYIVTV